MRQQQFCSCFDVLGPEDQEVDSLAFESLTPKPILQRYISLLTEHRRVILCGSSGTGKTFLAHKLAEYLIQRSVSVHTKFVLWSRQSQVGHNTPATPLGLVRLTWAVVCLQDAPPVQLSISTCSGCMATQCMTLRYCYNAKQPSFNPLVPELFYGLVYRQSRCPIFGDSRQKWFN